MSKVSVYLLVAIASLALLHVAYADVYLHSPRGSNNRLDEASRDRENGNRLFDSQNNDRGGYNVGNVYYYTGSTMYIEWTNQHSCGVGNNAHCELIMQYMCDDRIRDGSSRTTIPDKPSDCYNADCDADVRFGRHESFLYYQQCRWRSRNNGLFLGSQNPNGPSARFTRQNPNGQRRGYECPEERDYYPYWGPSPWRDIAILTTDETRCKAYQAESQNVLGRSFCDIPLPWIDKYLTRYGFNREGFIPINQTQCEGLYKTKEWVQIGLNYTGVITWKTAPAHNIPAPICRAPEWSRDNHLGNVASGYPATFNWTIPTDFAVSERCAFRLRYNISTGEFNVNGENKAWASSTSIKAGVDYTQNQIRAGGNANQNPAQLNLYSRFGLQYSDINGSFPRVNNLNTPSDLTRSRDYVLKNNPQVDIFGLPSTAAFTRRRLQLAVNTAQFGRTFQDRSHRFAVRRAPASAQGAPIINLQVRGKRGNIVQTYPGVEYDFAPTRLTLAPGTNVHIQWTGSNTNPDNNAGQGKAGTDRNNMVVLSGPQYAETGMITDSVFGHYGNNEFSFVNGTFLGLSKEDQIRLAVLDTFGGNLKELDDAGTYFDLGVRKVTQAGTYYYACTRNNNFSNRGQKGVIVVDPNMKSMAVQGLSYTGGQIVLDSGVTVNAPEGAITTLTNVQVSVFSSDAPSSLSGQRNSDFVQVLPINLNVASGQSVQISIPTRDYLKMLSPRVYRADSMDGNFALVSASQVNIDNGAASVSATQGGVYVVRNDINAGAVAGVVIGGVVFVAAVVGAIIFFKKRAAAAALEATKNSHAASELTNRA